MNVIVIVLAGLVVLIIHVTLIIHVVFNVIIKLARFVNCAIVVVACPSCLLFDARHRRT